MQKIVEFYTSRGVITAELYEEEVPETVANFCELVSKGFYNQTSFHKYVPGILIQAGSPTGAPDGWTEYFIKCETYAKRQMHDLGTISMANLGKNTGSSQFFFTLNYHTAKSLDGSNTCFGRILGRKSLERLMQLRKGDMLEKVVITEKEEINLSDRIPSYV